MRQRHGAAAERDHLRGQRVQELGEVAELRLAELLLAEREPFGNRTRRAPLDLRVEIDERPVQEQRDVLAERRLAGAHEADDRDVPLQQP